MSHSPSSWASCLRSASRGFSATASSIASGTPSSVAEGTPFAGGQIVSQIASSARRCLAESSTVYSGARRWGGGPPRLGRSPPPRRCCSSAWVNSDGMIQILFASPWAIWGSICRYW